jgi:hypothetical protein
MPYAKRWLFLIHRWLGVLLCAFFAMWFISGVVMMYVGYPKLTQAERLAHLPPLHSAIVGSKKLLEPLEALQSAGLVGPLQDLRLAVASGGRPVYLVAPAAPSSDAAPRPRRAPAPAVIDARTGERLQRVDAAYAVASARAFSNELNPSRIEYQGSINEDAFTHSRALDVHRPLHRLHLGDNAGTVVYVSSTTGEVVRDATQKERAWSYVGAWIHWLYPFRGNVFNDYWTNIVNWLSIAGIVLTVTGTVVGVLRWRFKEAYRSGSRTPYRNLMMRWHHVFGLIFAAVTFTWIFSGLMSMNPWKIFDSGARPLLQQAMNGGPLVLPTQAATLEVLLSAASSNVRELRWVRSAGHTLVLVHNPNGDPDVLDVTTAAPHTWAAGEIAEAAARLMPHSVVRSETLTSYDLHYYDRAAHTMTGGGDKPLPALRLVFDDPHATWVHIDLHTGALLGRTDSHRRISRWLFAMLHSWDWLPLLERRPLWDIILIVLSIGGTVMSVTGIVIGWRRLAQKTNGLARSSFLSLSARRHRPPRLG